MKETSMRRVLKRKKEIFSFQRKERGSLLPADIQRLDGKGERL